jgi:CHASE1-domain containing sensor protein/putative methionine-R-sulfoxide reductase with GAF domain/HAMP domain-containing protein
MLQFLLNISVRYKIGLIFVAMIGVIGGISFLYVSNATVQQGNASEINQTGFVRALSNQSIALAQEIVEVQVSEEELINAIELELQRTEVALTGLQGLFHSSDQVSRDEFNRYITEVQRDYPEITLVAYAPRITDNQALAFEDEVRLSGAENYRLYELNDAGQPVEVGARDEYYPYLYTFPQETGANLLGFDLASSPERLAALEQARDNGETTATAPIRLLLTERLGQQGVLIVKPIYRSGDIPATLEERRSSLQGFAIISVDMQAALDIVTNPLIITSQVAQIDDVAAGLQARLLYQNDALPASDIPRVTYSLPVFGREWVITLQPEVNLAEVESSLEAAQAALQARVIGLRAGSEELNLEGLERHGNADIVTAYEVVQASHQQLDSTLSRFLESADTQERVTLVPQIAAQGRQLFTDANLLTSTLESQIEQDSNQAIQQATIAVVASAVLLGLVLFTLYSILANLNQVQRVAEQLSAGQLTARSRLTTQDEIGQIGSALNLMADRVEGLVTNLESEVVSRTRSLETVLQVSNQIATILQPSRLLQDVTDITKERFGLYHSHVYILDAQQHLLLLTAGAGYVGRQMVTEQRSIDLANPQSIVASAARSRKSVNVTDVRQSRTFLAHPLLPNTRSELAIPLVARGQVLGVLDVQSDQANFFDEQTTFVLEALASQISTAISNARLYEVAERTSRHEQALGAITQKIQTAQSVEQVLQVTAQELGKALRVPYTSVELQATTSNGGEN